MRFTRDEMPNVVEQSAHFQHQAQVRAHLVDGAELIEEREREAHHLLGVLRVVIQASREPAGAGEEFGGAAFFFFGGGAHGILFGDVIEQDSLAHADARNEHAAQVQPLRQRIENNRGDADDFGAVFADAEDAHAAGHVEREHAPGLIAQQARIDRRNAFDHGAGGDAHEGFSITAAGDGDGAAETRRRGHGAAQKREDVMTQAVGVVFVNRAFDGKSFHQADGAERKADALLEDATLIKIQFEAAAAEIEDQARLDAVSQRPLRGRTNQARFFLAADYFQFYSGFALHAVHQAAVITRFARGGGGYGAIGADVGLVHAIAELAEGAGGAGDGVSADDAAGEGVVAQAHGGAFAIENLNVLGGSGAGDYQTNGVRPRVNGCQLNRGGH